MIIEIALGIVLGYILICLLPDIVSLAILGILIAVIVVVLFGGFIFLKNPENQEALAITVIFILGLGGASKLHDWINAWRKKRLVLAIREADTRHREEDDQREPDP